MGVHGIGSLNRSRVGIEVASDIQDVPTAPGAMFTRHAISPVEVVGGATFRQELVQSDSTNRAVCCKERCGSIACWSEWVRPHGSWREYEFRKISTVVSRPG